MLLAMSEMDDSSDTEGEICDFGLYCILEVINCDLMNGWIGVAEMVN